MNERITENFVRDHFKGDPLFSTIKLEEQKSYTKRVTELLQDASKSGKGIGKPEFIVSFPAGNMDYLLVIECKADASKHQSKNLDNAKDYAVDGVLHYASKLSAQFDVVAIAVSGQTKQELVVSNFVWKKGAEGYTERKNDARLLSINDYIKLSEDQQFADVLKTIDIVQKAIFLNELYHAYSITEVKRCTMVSAILLALINTSFRKSYKDASTANEVGDAIINAITHVLKQNKVKSQQAMTGEYQQILNEPLFTQDTIKHTKQKSAEPTVQVAKAMIEYLDHNVYPLTQMEENGFDVLGRFYTEFIRYAGSEQSQGLVLTPFHITDLFCDLAGLTQHSVVYDPCTGTGGFLIAAMKRMFELAGGNTQQKDHIKEHQLVGTELRPAMFTYACSNMMLRGDGKSNIYCGSCFELEKTASQLHKPNIAFLNPPYDVGTAGQMRFVEHALNVVSPQSGTVVAIVQMSCAIKNEKELISIKERLLQKHHLKAVLSMPDDLFYPVGVVTCVMVFEANKPNSGRKTWFGYFKDDGFEKRKHRGRVDVRAKWAQIKSRWVKAYIDKDEVSGLSIKAEVTQHDEWCAEAYMETDYGKLKAVDFERKLNDYIAFRFLTKAFQAKSITPQSMMSMTASLDTSHWPTFRLGEFFQVIKGKRLTKEDMDAGEIRFVASTEYNNGITAYIQNDTNVHESNCITVAYNGSIAQSFYQDKPFVASDDINILKMKGVELNPFIAMFLIVLLEAEKYRYSYGRKWHKAKMEQSILRLPATPKGTPDWEFMERYIKSLPYSSNL